MISLPALCCLCFCMSDASHDFTGHLTQLNDTNVSMFFVSCRAATDHNTDNTTAILREWLTVMQTQYHYVEWRPLDKPT